MLLASNASIEGDPTTESVYQSIAARMATLLDLTTMPTESHLEQEINRRVWWSIITSDTWSSAIHSLPRLLKPRDTVPLPMAESQFALLDYNSPPPQDSPMHATPHISGDPQSLLAQLIRLNLLLYDIIVLNVRVVAEQSQSASSLRLDHNLTYALDEWVNSLPKSLQYSRENVARWVKAGLGFMFIIMHINYNHAGQLLFYQYLHSAQDTEPKAPETVKSLAMKCKQHATNLCDLIYEAKHCQETVILYPLAAHILCLASTAQIHTLLFEVDESEICAAKIRLERNFEIISSMNEYWPTAHKTII
ncbi:hypothetical protein OPT61_g3152 [Boeremia exigua]|uniref:Uncharacterized protein n=1 Tax=Boeremia exigua TaxID=749465 RepID=A0ACC2IJ39_9PLEO|nr:hypothetical protein OPT61_g3152 [Boeremia exigua]